jgi:hypothetical protein
LFGTATRGELQLQLQALYRAVEGVKGQQTTITHLIEHQLTYTEELDENVRQNARDVTLLARILKLLISNFMKLNDMIKMLEWNVLSRLEYMANTSLTIRELDFLFAVRTRVYENPTGIRCDVYR